jgi:hypothetical protein
MYLAKRQGHARVLPLGAGAHKQSREAPPTT